MRASAPGSMTFPSTAGKTGKANSMKKIFLLVSGIAFCAANLVAEEIDGHKVLYWRGGGAYWSGKEWSATADGSKQSWEPNAIAVINSGNINFPQTNPLEVYGIRWNSGMKAGGSAKDFCEKPGSRPFGPSCLRGRERRNDVSENAEMRMKYGSLQILVRTQ